jgi:hypothetical protein
MHYLSRFTENLLDPSEDAPAGEAKTEAKVAKRPPSEDSPSESQK